MKKGVVIPLAIVKRGKTTPWTYKKEVATPWTCNQSLIKPSGFYSIRCSTFTQTRKWSDIDPPAQWLIRLITGTERLLTSYPVCSINANAANQCQWWLANLAWHNASIVSHFLQKETIIYLKLLIYYTHVVCYAFYRMRNATPVLPFKTLRPTHQHYFFTRKFPTVSFFTRTMRAKINPAYSNKITVGDHIIMKCPWIYKKYEANHFLKIFPDSIVLMGLNI